MAGDRQLVRRAVAAYFGGALVTSDAGICYQNGPLTSAGLGTAFPYAVKRIPDAYYTAGQPDGQQWGAVMGLKVARDTMRDSYGGPVSGFRQRNYAITCELVVLTELAHIEVGGAALDDLIDAVHGLIYADRTLGTTAPDGSSRLIIQAGEKPYGIKDSTPTWTPVDDKTGRYVGEGIVSFVALTMVEA